MTPARLQTIEEIYREALDQKPDQISAFLDRVCGGDEVLRRKVEALLNSRQRVEGFIEKSAVGLATKIIQNGQTDSLVGQTIGHYKISESIGTGGMGEVYLATDIVAGRKAALKLLPMRFTGDAERLKRFQQEARAVVALNHPNILTVYELGEDHSIHYIASELIEGETLRERLMRGQIQLSEAIEIAIQVEVRSPRLTERESSIAISSRRTYAPAGRIRESAGLWNCKACRIHLRRKRLRSPRRPSACQGLPRTGQNR